jgi:cytidine deaminase
MTTRELINAACSVAGVYKPSKNCESGTVGAAVLTKDGNIHTGVCIDTACSLGFCAEHAAIAEMLKHRESRIEMVVAVTDKGKIIPPCGRCRELLAQINEDNMKAKVIISKNKTITLRDMLPYYWMDVFK